MQYNIVCTLSFGFKYIYSIGKGIVNSISSISKATDSTKKKNVDKFYKLVKKQKKKEEEEMFMPCKVFFIIPFFRWLIEESCFSSLTSLVCMIKILKGTGGHQALMSKYPQQFCS